MSRVLARKIICQILVIAMLMSFSSSVLADGGQGNASDPIESLTVEGSVTRYDFERNELWGYGDYDGPWDRVDAWPRNDGSLTVTVVAEGVTYTGTADEVCGALFDAGYGDILSWHNNESPDVRWEPGEHTACLDAGGMSAEYTVYLLENPIQSLTVEGSVTRYIFDRHELWGYGDYDGPWDRVDAWPRNDESLTVTVVTESETFTGTAIEVYGALAEAGYDFGAGWHSDEEPDVQWEPGEHTAWFDAGGMSAEYTVHVLANPIQEIQVPDITRYSAEVEDMWGYEDADGQWVDLAWQRIDANPAGEEITVVTTEGTFTGYLGELQEQLREVFGTEIDCYWDSDDTPLEPWQEGGTYTATQYICGVGGEYTVTVLPTPELTLTVSDIWRYEFQSWLSGWQDYYDETTGEIVDPGVPWRIDVFPEEIEVTVNEHTYLGNPDEVRSALAEEEGIQIRDWHWDSDQVFGEEVKGGDVIEATFTFGWASAGYRFYMLADPADVTEIRDVQNDGPSVRAVIHLAEGENAKVCCARYDRTGKLISTEIRQLAVGDNEVTVQHGGAFTVRFFVLSENYAPLCAAVEITVA